VNCTWRIGVVRGTIREKNVLKSTISTKCGDATNSELTEGPRSRSRRSILASESKSFPASEVFWEDEGAPKNMLLIRE
jgi:hypothetical protein